MMASALADGLRADAAATRIKPTSSLLVAGLHGPMKYRHLPDFLPPSIATDHKTGTATDVLPQSGDRM